ncbi:hypothetical protein X773_22005 [Mesorhizobium sp. LSJC285A00]|nr:hypothetical protein X773_22005 [Mesorhizobium sp. LSJC285A00]
MAEAPVSDGRASPIIEAWLSRIEMMASSPSSVFAGIGIDAGRIEDRVLHLEGRGGQRLKLLMLFLSAADEAHRRHAVSIAIERVLSRLKQILIVGQTQIGTLQRHRLLPLSRAPRRGV